MTGSVVRLGSGEEDVVSTVKVVLDADTTSRSVVMKWLISEGVIDP